jgi:hypothetical protein
VTIAVLAFLLVAAVASLVAQRMLGPSESAAEDLEARLASAQAEREDLEAELITLREQRGPSDACRRSAMLAAGFITDWEEWRQLDAAWLETPEGSAEETDIFLALEAAMSSLRDTAAELRVTSSMCTGEG